MTKTILPWDALLRRERSDLPGMIVTGTLELERRSRSTSSPILESEPKTPGRSYLPAFRRGRPSRGVSRFAENALRDVIGAATVADHVIPFRSAAPSNRVAQRAMYCLWGGGIAVVMY
jgi:hypothetical protein